MGGWVGGWPDGKSQLQEEWSIEGSGFVEAKVPSHSHSWHSLESNSINRKNSLIILVQWIEGLAEWQQLGGCLVLCNQESSAISEMSQIDREKTGKGLRPLVVTIQFETLIWKSFWLSVHKLCLLRLKAQRLRKFKQNGGGGSLVQWKSVSICPWFVSKVLRSILEIEYFAPSLFSSGSICVVEIDIEILLVAPPSTKSQPECLVVDYVIYFILANRGQRNAKNFGLTMSRRLLPANKIESNANNNNNNYNNNNLDIISKAMSSIWDGQ